MREKVRVTVFQRVFVVRGTIEISFSWFLKFKRINATIEIAIFYININFLRFSLVSFCVGEKWDGNGTDYFSLDGKRIGCLGLYYVATPTYKDTVKSFKNHLLKFKKNAGLDFYDKNGLDKFINYHRADAGLEENSASWKKPLIRNNR